MNQTLTPEVMVFVHVTLNIGLTPPPCYHPSTPRSLYRAHPIFPPALARSCPSAMIASKQTDAALFRLFSLYKIKASVIEPQNTNYVDHNLIKSAPVAVQRVFKFELTLKDGTGELARKVLRASEQITSDLYKE
ncbi:heme binding [Ascochyta rabiei]|uniref:Heme binding n=1 Tax=Didymella rabiei TaxID=5454 RepID=A0A163D0S6_DIDRA|nr:heme binding [Ascochyta rabiei]